MRKEYLVFGALLALTLLLFGYESYSSYWHQGTGDMHGEMEPGMWDMHSRMMGPSVAGFNWTFWVFIILLAGFAYFILREKNEGPVDLLKKRYARGEISREEYLQAFKDLKRQ
jgi:uncharacterized membrane protein